MPTFPLPARPSLSYHEPPRSFGAPRDGGKRKHAACDLYAPSGTPVLACLDGKVIRGPYLFYDVVYALEVQHADGSIIRYGEIGPSGIVGRVQHVVGDVVREGRVIAYVGNFAHLSVSMLHFEMYSGFLPPVLAVGTEQPAHKATGILTDTSRPPFMRRADLIDPTAFLDSCILAALPVHPTT